MMYFKRVSCCFVYFAKTYIESIHAPNLRMVGAAVLMCTNAYNSSTKLTKKWHATHHISSPQTSICHETLMGQLISEHSYSHHNPILVAFLYPGMGLSHGGRKGIFGWHTLRCCFSFVQIPRMRLETGRLADRTDSAIGMVQLLWAYVYQAEDPRLKSGCILWM